jgi:cytochrome c
MAARYECASMVREAALRAPPHHEAERKGAYAHLVPRFVSATIALIVLHGESRAQQGDLELGRYLATECLACHRSATAGGAIPNIFGMAAPRFTTLIKAYRDKQLPNPIMQTIAGRLKDDEIEALAHYFSITKRP